MLGRDCSDVLGEEDEWGDGKESLYSAREKGRELVIGHAEGRGLRRLLKLGVVRAHNSLNRSYAAPH